MVRPGNGEIVQSLDGKHSEGQVNGWRSVRSEKRAGLCGMIVNVQVDVKRLLDRGGGTFHTQDQPIRMQGCDLEPVGFGKIEQSLIVLAARAESFGELLWRQILPKPRAGWIVKIAKEPIELRLIAQRQTNRQLQTLRSGKAADWLQEGRDLRAASSLKLLRSGMEWIARERKNRGNRDPKVKSTEWPHRQSCEQLHLFRMSSIADYGSQTDTATHLARDFSNMPGCLGSRGLISYAK